MYYLQNLDGPIAGRYYLNYRTELFLLFIQLWLTKRFIIQKNADTRLIQAYINNSKR